MIYIKMDTGTRLGNWMFQYAAAVSLDEEVAFLVDDMRFAERIRRCPMFKDLVCVTAPRHHDTKTYVEPSFKYRKIPFVQGEDLVIQGFFQSPRYFDVDKLRSRFAIDDELRVRLFGKYAEALSKPDVTAIHVRRGDYLRLTSQHPFVGEKYLKDAVACLPGVAHFIVISDDLAWCRKFFPRAFPEKMFYFSEGGNMLEDLYLPSLCKNNIISNSSFCWWGAWLNEHGGKRVVAPSLWFGFEYSKKGLDWSELYCKDWTVVDNGYTFLKLAHGYCNMWWRKFKLWAYPAYAMVKGGR